MKTLILYFALCISASAQAFTTTEYPATAWRLVWSNSNDGWIGPVAVQQVNNENGLPKILKTIPLNYQPFNTPLTNGPIIFTSSLSVTNNWSINTNAITKLIKDGTVCSINGGHEWKPGCGVFGCLVIHGDEPLRHCAVCKKVERRQLGPWK